MILHFKWLFAGYEGICSFVKTVTWGLENCLLRKCNIKNPNYDDDQNCLNKNVTKFPDFVVIFSGLHFVYFEKFKSRKVCIILFYHLKLVRIKIEILLSNNNNINTHTNFDLHFKWRTLVYLQVLCIFHVITCVYL